MNELNYDKEDVIEEISKLKIENYIETCIDRIDNTLPQLFVFGKKIQGKDIYIKIKIRNKLKHKIFCISFRFARHSITKYPYKIGGAL